MQESPVTPVADVDQPWIETPPAALPVLESSESDSVITTPYALQDTATQGAEDETEISLKELVERKCKEGFGVESFDTPRPSPKRKATGSPESEPEDQNPSNSPSDDSTPKLPSFPIGKRAQEKRPRHISPAFRKRLNFSPRRIQVQRRLDFLAVAEDEVEEFFNRVEANHPNIVGFIERFNFDVINDVPLPGRYEWVHVSSE